MKFFQADVESRKRALAAAITKRAALAIGNRINKDIMIVVDMTQPSNRKRLAVYDENMQLIREHHCSHGVNSSAMNRAYACKFSNKNMSKMTSLGGMVTGEVYYGKHGRSLRLHGLEEGINDNVYKRSVVIHSANYVTDKYILNNLRAGESWGCFAVDPAISNSLIDLVKDGAFLYCYYN